MKGCPASFIVVKCNNNQVSSFALRRGTEVSGDNIAITFVKETQSQTRKKIIMYLITARLERWSWDTCSAKSSWIHFSVDKVLAVQNWTLGKPVFKWESYVVGPPSHFPRLTFVLPGCFLPADSEAQLWRTLVHYGNERVRWFKRWRIPLLFPWL